jgi:hypothetical protein
MNEPRAGPSSRAGIPDRASSHPPSGEADSSSPTPGTRLCVAHFHLQSVAFRRGKSVSRRHKKGPGRAPSFARAQLLRDESCSAHPTLCSPAAWQTATGRWPAVAGGGGREAKSTSEAGHHRRHVAQRHGPGGVGGSGERRGRGRLTQPRRATVPSDAGALTDCGAADRAACHLSSRPQGSTGWLILLTRPRACGP